MSKFTNVKIGDIVAVKTPTSPYVLRKVTNVDESKIWIHHNAFYIETGMEVYPLSEDSQRFLLTESEAEISLNLFKINNLNELTVKLLHEVDDKFDISDLQILRDKIHQLLMDHCTVKQPKLPDHVDH